MTGRTQANIKDIARRYIWLGLGLIIAALNIGGSDDPKATASFWLIIGVATLVISLIVSLVLKNK